MSKEYDALTALRGFLAAQMAPYPQSDLVDAQVSIGYPDVDRMPYPVMLYIVPEGASFERLTTESLAETLNAKVYIVSKYSAAHTTMSALIQASFDYFAAMVNAINTDPTCGGSFIESIVESFDYYPAVTGLTNASGIECNVSMLFERTPLNLPGDILPGIYVFPTGD